MASQAPPQLCFTKENLCFWQMLELVSSRLAGRDSVSEIPTTPSSICGDRSVLSLCFKPMCEILSHSLSLSVECCPTDIYSLDNLILHFQLTTSSQGMFSSQTTTWIMLVSSLCYFCSRARGDIWLVNLA